MSDNPLQQFLDLIVSDSASALFYNRVLALTSVVYTGALCCVAYNVYEWRKAATRAFQNPTSNGTIGAPRD